MAEYSEKSTTEIDIGNCSLESQPFDLNVLQKAKQSEFLYKSLQQCKVEQNRAKLYGIKEITPKTNSFKHAKLDGLIAVLDSLFVPSEYESKFTTTGKWKGYLPFDIAFDLYSDFVYTGSHNYTTIKQQNYQFRTDLLHPEYGLCVYIFQHNEDKFVILQNDQMEMSSVLNEIARLQEMAQSDDQTKCELSFELVQGILDTLDSEWSRLAVRGLLASMLSEKQLINIGIKPTTGNASLYRLKYVIEETKNAKLAAKDIVHLKIRESLNHLTNKDNELQKTLQNSLLSDANRKKIEEELFAVKERYRQKLLLQSNEDSLAFTSMVLRVAQNLIEENRLKARQQGAGRPTVLDEDTMELVVKTLESESGAERRRRDSVLYCDKSRVKQGDLLHIANHYLEEQGKPCIKSSRTVALWQKPRKSNTREAKRHHKSSDQRFFFTCKKPEKTLEESHIDTHHQRAHVKLVRLDAYKDEKLASITLDISMDDKATVKADTDVGWYGTKGRGILMSTEKPQRYKEHDFVGVENQVTPSAFRAMKWTVSDVDNQPALVRSFDQSFVTVRPKDKKLLGSSGGVWASEQIRLVEEFPTVFCMPTSLHPSLSTFLLRVQHHCYLYNFSTEYANGELVTQEMSYEEERNTTLHNGVRAAVEDFQASFNNIPLSQKESISSICQQVEELSKILDTCSVPGVIKATDESCKKLYDSIISLPERPVPYPNVLELTDKGPGAGVHNIEVQEFFVLVCHLLESDHRIRLHRAPHDSAQNEAERTNAAIGEALTTGSPVAPPNDPFHGLSTAELERMRLKDIEEHCIAWKEANTWTMANQIAQRIHDESGPGKNDFLISVASYHPERHILLHLSKYLLKWRKASPQQRLNLCGNGLFSKLQNFKDAHVNQGQYYLEYLKFSCDPICEECKNKGWTGGIPIKRSPLPTLNPSSPGKYLSFDENRLTPREIDSVLPSVQLKKMFLEKTLTSSDNQAVRQACSNLNIEEITCREYLKHLEFLELKAEKRNQERNTIPADICWESRESLQGLTNKQLRLYLTQEGLKVSGNKTQLIERILQHAGCSTDIEEDSEDANMSSDTSSDSSDEEESSEDENHVEQSFQILFVNEDDIPQIN